MRERLAELDARVLAVLAPYQSGNATYVIRNMLSWSNRPNFTPGLRTSDVLRSCRRLEKRGHVVEVPSVYAVMKEWAVTEAGRAALEGGGNAK
ncbi:hypothetical protein [Ancylobacter oerskovii]|uniref:Uncharacterized protein n=1 Tax=Ancylobacter oerskovii TaxID=459519 RepID=A0ABW4Z1H2_9HYPH|nr:hypothetical protein [Ancylobacter oerskovii]MBS7545068.1 hypothetical protein [Ancylobacter oerskovii]